VPQTDKGKGVLESLEFALQNRDIKITIVPIGLGMCIIRNINPKKLIN